MSRADKREKLRLLREARKTGRLVVDSGSEDEEIYDEVDENTYLEHKRKQLMNDDFIVDDDGEGYVDNGVDEWDDSTRPQYYSDEEEETTTKKRKRKEPKVTKTAQINNFFKPATSTAPTKKIETNVDDILEDFDVAVPKKKQKKEKKDVFAPKTTKNKVSKNAFSFSTTVRKRDDTMPSSPIRRNKLSAANSDVSSPVKRSEVSSPVKGSEVSSPVKRSEMSSPTKEQQVSSPQMTENIPIKTENKDSVTPEVEEESDDSDEDVVITRRPRQAAPQRPTVSNFSSVKTEPRPVSSPVRAFTENVTKKVEPSAVGETFKMYWFDYSELDDSLLLFGKVPTKEGGVVSAVVQVSNMNRELYFLPRKFRRDDETEAVTPKDVYEEITPMFLQKFGLDTLKAKPAKMKYAFELPDVPKGETEYLKVLLPYKTKLKQKLSWPPNVEGDTFSHVFGGNAAIFESFVLQRNIMGPCWLEIKNGDFTAMQNTSHCQLEVSVASADSIVPIADDAVPPALTVTSISVQTTLNKNQQEVVSISMATFKNVPQEERIDENMKPNDVVTLVRPVHSANLPPGLQAMAEKKGLNVRVFPNERMLLNCLAGMIKTIDPDVFVGHKLENISLDVIVHRMHQLGVATWSTLGRRNRRAWPQNFGRSSGFNNNIQLRLIFDGRLLCDIANEMGQSITPKCQSWDLAEMYEVACRKKHAVLDVNFLNPQYGEDANLLLMALTENASQVQIAAEIAFAIQILMLSKKLTNIAGNAWSHTLSGTRVGRNEYILLHEFKNNNYIVPDKESKYNKTTNNQQQAQMETAEDEQTSNKKPKYQGGLVFEPEKGLHKNYILVMDFNSLYPSIIQEFNICFTTVERDNFNRTHDEDRDMPDLPDRDVTQGVLPRLLNKLVSRRREVKKLLKDPNNTAFQNAQHEITQQALKLTANSMYGCLGYVNSRFYAKPLAMMVTNKGREILMDTRQLAELLGLRVVYGDTDSVMIDTGTDNFQDAWKVGESFKVHVNERYKLLEIDIDNVFKRLLLHAKKKYAAMNAQVDRKTGKETTSLEVKGLDMRRREYCPLSKEVSTFVLNKVLSDMDPEQALQSVYEFLEATSVKVKENQIRLDKYAINTKLSKDPSKYPNAATMPPVQVAFRMMKENKVVKAGSVITYVITKQALDEDTSSPAQRARSLQEVMKNQLVPDPVHYLEKQILAPIERLVERIEGVDMVRIAGALGLDTRRFIMRARSGDRQLNEIMPLESSISDSERFRQASFLVLQCGCGHKFRFGGIQASNDYMVNSNGICCMKCKKNMPPLKVNAQLESAIRTHISLYYAGWLVCDDAACKLTTRQISVYGKRCIGMSGKAHGCKGVMRYKYSDKALYNQLLYFDSVFDVDKAKENKLRSIEDTLDGQVVPKLPSGQVLALAEQNRALFETSQEVVQKYLGECGRRYVNMGSIFDFMAF